MATIVYQTNKKTGVVYAYRSESYRDPITKKPTSRRTYLGRVDPVTKEIIRKAEEGKRNRSKLIDKSKGELSLAEAVSRITEQEKQIKNLQDKVDELLSFYKLALSNSKDILKLATELQQFKLTK